MSNNDFISSDNAKLFHANSSSKVILTYEEFENILNEVRKESKPSQDKVCMPTSIDAKEVCEHCGGTKKKIQYSSLGDGIVPCPYCYEPTNLKGDLSEPDVDAKEPDPLLEQIINFFPAFQGEIGEQNKEALYAWIVANYDRRKPIDSPKHCEHDWHSVIDGDTDKIVGLHCEKCKANIDARIDSPKPTDRCEHGKELNETNCIDCWHEQVRRMGYVPKQTGLDEHALIQFLTGWGINQASKLGKDICKHFAVGKVVSVPSDLEIDNAVFNIMMKNLTDYGNLPDFHVKEICRRAIHQLLMKGE